jgi:hypothetical protein
LDEKTPAQVDKIESYLNSAVRAAVARLPPDPEHHRTAPTLAGAWQARASALASVLLATIASHDCSSQIQLAFWSALAARCAIFRHSRAFAAYCSDLVMLRALAPRPATGCFLARSFAPSANVTFVLIVTFLSGRTEFCEASDGRRVAPTLRVREHLTEDEMSRVLAAPKRNRHGQRDCGCPAGAFGRGGPAGTVHQPWRIGRPAGGG